MAGFNVVVVPSTVKEWLTLTLLEGSRLERRSEITNPNTLGIFEKNVLRIAESVHDAVVSYTMMVQLQRDPREVRPGAWEFVIVHLNLHKTFRDSSRGGGPGAGPVGVRKDLEPILARSIGRF